MTLIVATIDLRAFDEMFRARGGLHRWTMTPRLVVQQRVLRFTSTSDLSYVATAGTMPDTDIGERVADLRMALPQLTAQTFTDFVSVEIETADEGEAVSILRQSAIVVARYEGLADARTFFGYGRWAWNGARHRSRSVSHQPAELEGASWDAAP